MLQLQFLKSQKTEKNHQNKRSIPKILYLDNRRITDIQVKSNFQGVHTHCRISAQSIVQSPRRLQCKLMMLSVKFLQVHIF